MTQGEFNSFCASLPHTHRTVQWNGADVWKVGKPPEVHSEGGANGVAAQRKPANKFKMFCAAWWDKADEYPRVTFHCSEIGYEMLKDTPGCRPAPYMASRGLKWIQRFSDAGISDAALKDYIKGSHRLMTTKLTKTLQRELGFLV